MFGTNEIVGTSFFKDAPPNSLFVTSIFYTIQGEGPYTGRPCVFLRLTKCNLACSFCDTVFDQGQWMTFTEIKSKIYSVVCDYWNLQGKSVPLSMLGLDTTGVSDTVYGCGLVVTGGEPTLQQNLSFFMEDVKYKFAWTQIESNGVITRGIPTATTLVVSPKCAEKDGAPTRYLKPADSMLLRADCLKFVVCAPLEGVGLEEQSPYSGVPIWASDWAARTNKPVYISPMNVYLDLPKTIKLQLGKKDKTIEERSTKDEVVSFWESGVFDLEANRRNHEYAAKLCLENNFRLSLQTHLYVSLA